MASSDIIIRRPDGELYDYVSLATSSDEVLEEILRSSFMPDMDDITGWEFRGYNVSDILTLARMRKFKQGFHDNEGGFIIGYRVKVRQNRLGEAWIDKVKRQESVKHSWCDVCPVRSDELDNIYPNALLFNHACKRNPRLDPSRLRRDYLAQVYPDNKDLLLGKSYIALLHQHVPIGFFVLERYNPSTL